MRKTRIMLVLLVAAVSVLALFTFALALTPRSEVQVTNDTETQVSIYITTMEKGRKHWELKPGTQKYLSLSGVRMRVRSDDLVQIADWGKAEVQDIARFDDGVWKISLRHAFRVLKR